MVNFKKAAAVLLTAVVVFLTAAGAMATNNGDLIMPPIFEIVDEKPSYQPFTGTVQEVRDAEFAPDLQHVIVENDEGKTAHLVVSADTYFVNEKEIVEGMLVTGYYDANLPIIMIYPPQYSIVVMVVEPLEEKIKVDRFDADLVSSDNQLKVNITDETEIILPDGKPYTGELTNKDLVILYEESDKSIPALAVAQTIVVLLEQSEPFPDEKCNLLLPDVSSMEVVVEGRVIETPSPYYKRDDVVMVPLRAISEALGYQVTWDHEKRLVELDGDYRVSIGTDAYFDTSSDRTLLRLGAAPELVEGRTYVPLQFFRAVIPMNNAYVFEAQIVIDNEEKMN